MKSRNDSGVRHRQMFGLALLIVAALSLMMLRTADAHQLSIFFCEIHAEGREVAITVQLSNGDLYEALELEREWPATSSETRAGAAQVAQYLASRITVTNHGQPCTSEPEEYALIDRECGRLFVQRLRYRCLSSLEDTVFTYNLFFDVDARHQGLARVYVPGRESKHAFRSQNRTLALGQRGQRQLA